MDTRSQFVLRYYKRGNECVSYPYGHCRKNPEDPELFKYKEECDKNCLPMPSEVIAGPVPTKNPFEETRVPIIDNGINPANPAEPLSKSPPLFTRKPFKQGNELEPPKPTVAIDIDLDEEKSFINAATTKASFVPRIQQSTPFEDVIRTESPIIVPTQNLPIIKVTESPIVATDLPLITKVNTPESAPTSASKGSDIVSTTASTVLGTDPISVTKVPELKPSQIESALSTDSSIASFNSSEYEEGTESFAPNSAEKTSPAIVSGVPTTTIGPIIPTTQVSQLVPSSSKSESQPISTAGISAQTTAIVKSSKFFCFFLLSSAFLSFFLCVLQFLLRFLFCSVILLFCDIFFVTF